MGCDNAEAGLKELIQRARTHIAYGSLAKIPCLVSPLIGGELSIVILKSDEPKTLPKEKDLITLSKNGVEYVWRVAEVAPGSSNTTITAKSCV